MMNVLLVVLTVLFLLFLDAVSIRVFVFLRVCFQLFGIIQFPLLLAFNSFNLVILSANITNTNPNAKHLGRICIIALNTSFYCFGHLLTILRYFVFKRFS